VRESPDHELIVEHARAPAGDAFVAQVLGHIEGRPVDHFKRMRDKFIAVTTDGWDAAMGTYCDHRMSTTSIDPREMTIAPDDLEIRAADSFDPDAIALLREAAIEARQIYADRIPANAPWPTNMPVPVRGIYLLAFKAGVAAGCAALNPLDVAAGEIRRMYVDPRWRRSGVGSRLLQALETAARDLGYETLRLETGIRQPAAIRLYENAGFHRIERFGAHGSDPLSVCYEKVLRRPG
jgi:putative acetyltransferase